jgi:hypothetical protein
VSNHVRESFSKLHSNNSNSAAVAPGKSKSKTPIKITEELKQP